jgi:MFS family permease
MRPIGGVLVGHIGDKFGRRTALTFSVTAMAIPTFLVGLLPTYQTIGVLALGSLCCGLCRDFQCGACGDLAAPAPLPATPPCSRDPR